LGWVDSPEASIKTRAPWFMTACKTLLLFSLLAKPQELPVSQLAMCVHPFHLVITDKRRPVAQLFSGRNILPSSWCGPSYKAPYPFQPSCCTLNPSVSLAVCASNKFFSTCGVVFVWQFLTTTFIWKHKRPPKVKTILSNKWWRHHNTWFQIILQRYCSKNGMV
jgi:hypothetical protein